jgi:rhodanese-related sulfurtransferase
VTEQIPTATVADITDGVVILDVREQGEWDDGHVAGAIHIPMGEVPARYGELPEGADLIVMCHIGGRSGQVTAWLNAQGVPCRNLDGGIVTYAKAGLPIEK